MKFIFIIMLVVGVSIIPAAFAEHEQVTITTQPKSATCEMNDPCFTPNTITVNAGSEVVWHNGDDGPRNIVIATLGDCTADMDACMFDDSESLINTAPILVSTTIHENGQYSMVFDETGTFPFYDPNYARAPGIITVQESPDTEEYRKITIGGVFDITGNWALVGDETKTAAEIAVVDFNKFLHATGADWRLAIQMEDSQTNANVALEKVTTLNGKGRDLLVGMALSSHLRASYSYIENNDMLVVSCCSTLSTLAIDDHIFRLRPDDSRQAPAMNAMLENAQIEVVYMINRNDAWGDGFKHGIRDIFDGVFVEGVSYDPIQKDLSASASIIDEDIEGLISEYGAERVGVFYIGFDELILLTETLKHYQYASQVRWFGSNTQADADQFITNPTSLEFFETTNFTAVKTVTPDNTIRQYVDGRISEIYDRKPSVYSHSAYDSIWLLGYAIQMTQSTDPDVLKSVMPLIAERMTGSFGDLRLNDAGDVATESYEIWSVRDGEWVMEYTFDAGAQ